jgi:hypothetical protein
MGHALCLLQYLTSVILPLLEKLSLQLFLMANFDRVNGPIDMRVWKGCRFENIQKLDRDLK